MNAVRYIRISILAILCLVRIFPASATCNNGMSIKIKPVLFVTKNANAQVINRYSFSIWGSSEIGDDNFSADRICLSRDNVIDQVAYWAPGADSIMLYRCDHDTAWLVVNIAVDFFNNLVGDRCINEGGDEEIANFLIEGLSLDVLTGGETSGIYAVASEDYESSAYGFIILFTVEVNWDRLVSDVYVPDTLETCANTFPYLFDISNYQYPDKVTYFITTWKKYNTGSSSWETLETTDMFGAEGANKYAFEEPGRYTFVSSTILNSSECMATDTFDLIAIDTPEVSIPETQALCGNGETELSITPDSAFASFIWQDIYGNCLSRYDSLVVADTGKYTVMVTDTNGCYSRHVIEVEIKNSATLAFTDPVIYDCFTLPNTVELEPVSVDFTSFRWSTGDSSTSITVAQPGDYRVSVTDDEGCVSNAMISVVDSCARRTVDDVLSHSWIAEISKSLFDDSDSNQVRVMDPRSMSEGWGYGEYDMVRYTGIVRLQYHRSMHTDFLDSIWTLTVPYTVTINDDATEAGTLVLKKTAAQHDVYEAVNVHTGGAMLDLEIDEENIEVLDRNGDEQELNFLPGDINMELDMRIIHVPDIVSGSSGTTLEEEQFTANTDDGNKKIHIVWEPLREAVDYEVGMVFADAFDQNQTINEALFKEKGWTIVTAANDYTLDATFPDGTFAYRIRPRSRFIEGADSNFTHIKYGKWSAIKNIDILPSGGEGDLLAFEPAKNWSKVVTFAEEGKKKEVISYMDEVLRTKQVQTNLNTEHLTLVAETYYDHESRPVLNVLPVPIADNNLVYKYGLATVGAYPMLKKDFDMGVQPALDITSNSAAGYYSLSNPHVTNPVFYKSMPISNIPYAEGYVTTQVEYLRDNTGRIFRQSGVGKEFSLDSLDQNHYTRYFYATPTQSELQRLFGSNAGEAVYYTKEMVVDPNGQVSVTYKNNNEKIIATALSGDSPASLLSLDRPEPAGFTQDLSRNNIRDTSNYLSSSSNIILNDKVNKVYTFRYRPIVGVNENGYCKSCNYKLEIYITDPKGNFVNLSGEGNTLPEYMSYVQDADENDIKIQGLLEIDKCSDTDYVYEELEFEVTFSKPGNYTFNKILTLEKGNADAGEYTDALEQLNFPTLEEFIENHAGEYIDSLSCRNDCEGLMEVYIRDLKKQDGLNGNEYEEEHYDAVRDSLESSGWCDPFTAAVNDSSEYAAQYCENILQNIVRQISPGEKYFTTRTYPAIANAVTPEKDSLIAWGIYISGNNSEAAIEERWEFEWGEKVAWLFEGVIHPEYCHYSQCLDDTVYAGFDLKISMISGFQEAVDSGYIVATGSAEANSRNYNYGPRLVNEIARIPGLESVLDTFLVFRDNSTNTVYGSVDAIDAVRPRFSFNFTGSYYYRTSEVYYTDSSDYDNNGNSTINTAEWDSIYWLRLVSTFMSAKKRAINIIHRDIQPYCPYLDDEEAIVKNPAPDADETAAFFETYMTQDLYCSSCRGNAEMQYNLLVASCTALRDAVDEETSDEIIDQLEEYCLSVCGPENPLGIITNQAIANGDLDAIIAYIEGLGEDVDTCNIADLLDSHFDYHCAQDSLGDTIIVYMCDTVACSIESMIDVANQYSFMYPPVDSLIFREGFDGGVSTPFYAHSVYLDTSRNNGRILNRNVARYILDNYSLIPLYEDYYRHMSTYYDATGDSLGYYLSHGTEDNDDFDEVCWGTIDPVDVQSGKQYLLSYYLANSSFDNVDIHPVISATNTAYADTLISASDTLACILGWNRYHFYWTAPYGVDSIHIRLLNQESHSWGNDFMIDEIRLELAEEVPLPDIHCTDFKYHKFFAKDGEITAAYKQCDSTTYNGGLNTLFFVDSSGNQVKDIEYLDSRKYVSVSPVSPPAEYAYRNVTYQHFQYTAHRTGGSTKTVFAYVASCAMPDWEFVNDNGASTLDAILAAWQLGVANSTYLDDEDNYACNRDYDTCVLKPHYVVDTLFGYPYDSLMADYQPDTSYEDCIERQKNAAEGLLTNLYMDSLAYIITQIDRDQVRNCFATLGEEFSVTSLFDEYHYTLYYYDQAGNLIQTVPPAGVYPVASSHFDSLGVWDGTEPDHALKTIYQYNSRNQPLWQSTPDGGETHFWYNKKGQMILSQNAKQKPHNRFSFSHYDALGRIDMAGEIRTSEEFDTLAALSDPLFPLNPETSYPDSLEDIVQTIYDIPVTIPGLSQENLRNRVSASYTFETYEDLLAGSGVATIYSYDEAGNVKTVVQDLSKEPELAALEQNADPAHLKKRVDYKYDLVSGNVNKVIYNKYHPDQFIHRYEYDADNRITDVYTATDGILEHHDAQYFYYPHGPLARIELGNDKIQSLDYVYTLQGWLKSINGIRYSYNGLHEYEGVKQLITTLGYYEDDYEPLNNWSYSDNEFSAFAPFYSAQASGYKGLYNGNIIYTVTDLFGLNRDTAIYGFDGSNSYNDNKTFLGMQYRYDQLNRIRYADGRLPRINTYDLGEEHTIYTRNSYNPHDYIEAAVYDGYKSAYTYDPNGNITTLLRYAPDIVNHRFNLMDSLTYAYATHAISGKMFNNRLYHVNDFQTDVLRFKSDIDDLGEYSPDLEVFNPDLQYLGSNYAYDQTGNLIQDISSGITQIIWNPYGKIEKIDFELKPDLKFKYDAAGNRIAKIITKKDGSADSLVTYYFRDAQGNPLDIVQPQKEGEEIYTEIHEFNLYGSSRLGTRTDTIYVSESPEPDVGDHVRYTGEREYELTNHLGNVLTTVSDQKYAHLTDSEEPELYYQPVVTTVTDYYPFGMPMPGRSGFSQESHCFIYEERYSNDFSTCTDSSEADIYVCNEWYNEFPKKAVDTMYLKPWGTIEWHEEEKMHMHGCDSVYGGDVPDVIAARNADVTNGNRYVYSVDVTDMDDSMQLFAAILNEDTLRATSDFGRSALGFAGTETAGNLSAYFTSNADSVLLMLNAISSGDPRACSDVKIDRVILAQVDSTAIDTVITAIDSLYYPDTFIVENIYASDFNEGVDGWHTIFPGSDFLFYINQFVHKRFGVASLESEQLKVDHFIWYGETPETYLARGGLVRNYAVDSGLVYRFSIDPSAGLSFFSTVYILDTKKVWEWAEIEEIPPGTLRDAYAYFSEGGNMTPYADFTAISDSVTVVILTGDQDIEDTATAWATFDNALLQLKEPMDPADMTPWVYHDFSYDPLDTFYNTYIPTIGGYAFSGFEQEGVLEWNDTNEELELSYLPGSFDDSAITSAIITFEVEPYQKYVISYDIDGPVDDFSYTFYATRNNLEHDYPTAQSVLYSREYDAYGHHEDTVFAYRDTMSVMIRIKMEDTAYVYTLDNFRVEKMIDYTLDTLEYEDFESSTGNWRTRILPGEWLYDNDEAGRLTWIPEIPAVHFATRASRPPIDSLYPFIGYMVRYFEVDSGMLYKARIHATDHSDSLYALWAAIPRDTLWKYSLNSFDLAIGGTDIVAQDTSMTFYFRAPFSNTIALVLAITGLDTPVYAIIDTVSLDKMDTASAWHYIMDTTFVYEYSYDTVLVQNFEEDIVPWRNYLLEKDTVPYRPGFIEYDEIGDRLKITQGNFTIPGESGGYFDIWGGAAAINLTVEPGKRYRVKYNIDRSEHIDTSFISFVNMTVKKPADIITYGLFESPGLYEQQNTEDADFVSGMFAGPDDTVMTVIIAAISFKEYQEDPGYVYIDNFVLEEVIEVECNEDSLNLLANGDDYRFGFNGQERDNEIYGPGLSYTAMFWEYDPRLGRRWNIDPIEEIGLSRYSTFRNNPILFNDVDGDQPPISIPRTGPIWELPRISIPRIPMPTMPTPPTMPIPPVVPLPPGTLSPPMTPSIPTMPRVMKAEGFDWGGVDQTDPSTWPLPPPLEGQGELQEGQPSNKKARDLGQKRWYDEQGREYRPHVPDKYHPKGHWDVKDPGKFGKWRNYTPEGDEIPAGKVWGEGWEPSGPASLPNVIIKPNTQMEWKKYDKAMKQYEKQMKKYDKAMKKYEKQMKEYNKSNPYIA